MFDDKNEKFEIFENLFYTGLKMQTEVNEAMKSKTFRAHLMKGAF